MRTRSPATAVLLALALLFTVVPAVPAFGNGTAPGDLFISEYIEGSSNNKAIEIYNGTDSAVDLGAGGYDLQVYFNGSTSAGLTIALTGSAAAGDVFVVAHSSATPSILAVADQTNGAGWFNGDDAVVLRKAGTAIDVIGQIGFDPGSQWGSDLTSTQDNTLRRKEAVCAGDPDGSDAFDPSLEWSGYAQDTFDGLGSHTATCEPTGQSVVINEFSASTTGTDVEYVEIYGTPSTDFSSLTILEIEGDGSPANPGVVDGAWPVGTTDADGFWLADLPANAIENGTVSLLLVEGFSGSESMDLDTDDDGAFDATPWTAIVDSVAVNDGGSSDRTYGVPALGPNYDGVSSFAPGGASRIPDGVDTDTTADWVRNDFDLAGIAGYTGSITVGEAYNTPGAPNQAYAPPPEACGDPFTPIYDVQGSGSASPLVGDEVAVEGVVVGDVQTGGFNGFYVQDPTGDADAATSDGVFVYASGAADVSVGDAVRVRGSVSEYFGMTEVSASQVWICGTAALPTPAEITFPLPSDDFLERFEGMYVSVPGPVYVSEYFNFDRYGEVVVTPERQFQPTAVYDPSDPAADALRLSNMLQRITVDDGRNDQNPDPAIHPDGTVFDLDHLFRGGGTLTNLTGVLDYRFSLYRIQPPDWESLTARAVYTDANPRGDVPQVGGRLTAASFNVLNYFSTIDDHGPVCGPSGDQGCRGADTREEFTRQRDKIFVALAEIDADVVGLMEIENGQAALDDLVGGLNGVVGTGTYASIDVLPTGTDAISVAVIYKPGSVTPVGAAAALDDPGFLDPFSVGEDKNRPAIAQTFVENATGERFTVVVNHLKSKGSDCGGPPDDDPLQGNCNLTRTAAAEYLMDWLAGDPTGSGDRDVLLLGDYNAYDHEDPIGAILEGADDAVGTTDDFTDLLRAYEGEYAYTYVFDGQLGYLDYGLASSTLASQVTGAAAWHVNADEPDILDYDTSFKKPAQDALYAPDAYRSSDHDPVIVGLDLTYEFGGFEPPIMEENTAKAGRAIPVKFSLGGFFGYDVIADVYWQDGTDIDAASIGGGLKYDRDDDMYVIVLETDKDWKGETLDLVLELVDGTVHTATFDFR